VPHAHRVNFCNRRKTKLALQMQRRCSVTRGSTLLLIAATVIAARGQQISVFDTATGKPIAEASLTLSGPADLSLQTDSDSEGHAAFADLHAGAYRLRVERAGYVDLADPGSHGHPLIVSPAKSAVAVGLTRGAAISGQVLDAQGGPLAGAQIMAVARRSMGADTRLERVGEPARTDDRGIYRLHDLPPGHYTVVAVPSGEDTTVRAFAPTYYATFFSLEPGATRTSVNLQIDGAPPSKISGTISGLPDDAAFAVVALATRTGIKIPVQAQRSGDDGAFVLENVPPGEYRLTVWSHGPSSRTAVRSITVSGGDLHVDLELRPLVKTTGRVIWNGQRCTGAEELAFHPEDSWLEEWEPDIAFKGDAFTVSGLPAGRYRIEMPHLAAGCRLASPVGFTLLDGNTPLTLVLASAVGQIEGVVTPPGKSVVVALPDSDGDIRIAPVDAEGHYRFSDMPAGSYRLVALAALNSVDYLDPVESERLGAKKVTVEAGRTAQCDLTLVPK
jgi:hypothetical protein